MPTAESLQVTAQLNLAQYVDDRREPTDNFRFPAFLRTQIDADLAALELADAATLTTESQRLGKSSESRAAIDDLETYLREGYKWIDAIRSSKITEGQRREVFAIYGWSQGLIGRFNDSRTIALARLGVHNPEEIDPEFHYPADLVTDLQEALDLYDAAEPESGTGDRQLATAERNEKLEAARQSLSQARFYYCGASRELDQSKELSKIGFQPRRDPGEVRRRPSSNGTPVAETSEDVQVAN